MAELDALVQVPGLSAELDVVVGRSVRKAISAPLTPAERSTRWRALGAPMDKRVTVSGTVSAAQAGAATPTAAFSWDIRPQSGRVWAVRKIVLQASGAGPFAGALVNVTAAIFVTGQPLTGLMPGIGQGPPNIDCDDTSFSLPQTRFYATHQLPVRGTEWLSVVLQGSGVTTGLQLFGHARVTEIDDDPAFLLDL